MSAYRCGLRKAPLSDTLRACMSRVASLLLCRMPRDSNETKPHARTRGKRVARVEALVIRDALGVSLVIFQTS